MQDNDSNFAPEILESLPDLAPHPISQIVRLVWETEGDAISLRPRLRRALVVFALACALLPVVLLVVLSSTGAIELGTFPIVLICATLITLPIVLTIIAKRMLAPLRAGDVFTVDRRSRKVTLPLENLTVACDQITTVITMQLTVTRMSSSGGGNSGSVTPALAWFVVLQDGNQTSPHGLATLEVANGANKVEAKLRELAQEFDWPRQSVQLTPNGDLLY